MKFKTTEIIGTKLITSIQDIERFLDEKNKKQKLFRKEKDQIEAMKNVRVAFIEVVQLLKNTEPYEDKAIKEIFEAGATGKPFDDFWKEEFDRTEKPKEETKTEEK
jgi:hypothetical protein